MKKAEYLMKFVLILIIFSLNAFSYEPSLESLFRNSNNVDVGNNTVVANLSIKELDPETNQPLKAEDSLSRELSVKLLVYNENEERPRLTQVEYKGGKISYATLFDFKEKSFNRLGNLIRNPEAVDAKAFYSLMAMLLNNDGSFMVDFLKTFNSKVKSNSEIINRKKVKLLSDYKNYLLAVKKEKETPIPNPLQPEAEEKKERVREIMRESFLKKDELIKRVKRNDRFVWSVAEENITANFDSNHRIRDMKVSTGMGDIQFVFGRFLVFGSQFEFPEFIWMTDTAGKKYEIRASSIKIFQDSSKWHQSRLEKYLKAKKENNFSEAPFKPSFAL